MPNDYHHNNSRNNEVCIFPFFNNLGKLIAVKNEGPKKWAASIGINIGKRRLEPKMLGLF